MSVAIFHDVDVKSEARDNKRLTSKENKGKEALHSKNDKKEMSASIETKGEVREPERLTLNDKNIVGARPNVHKAHGKYGGESAPNSNGERTMTHPKNEFSKAETTKRYGNRDSQYGGNRSRRLNIHRDDKNRNDEECQKGFSGWQMSGLDQKVSKIQMCKDPMSSYADFINGPETNNIAHGGALSLDTNTDDPSTNTLILKNFETAKQARCETVQNKFETIQQSDQR